MKKAKKKLIEKGIILIAFYIIIVILANILYIQFVEKEKQIFLERSQWKKYSKTLEDNELEYAIFGDSHAKNGINPFLLNKSFNFGKAGQGYTEIYFRLKKLVGKENFTVDNIILQVDINSFSPKIRGKEDLFNEIRYYDDLIELRNISMITGRSFYKMSMKKYFPVFGKGRDFIEIMIGEQTQLKRGWRNNTKNFSKQDKMVIARKAVNQHFNSSINIIREESVDYFLKIIELAINEKMDIYILMYPLSKEYLDEIEIRNISRKEFYSEIFNRINNITTNYTVLNHTEEFINKPYLFADSQHLNYAGADTLTNEVRKDINEFEQEDKEEENEEKKVIIIS